MLPRPGDPRLPLNDAQSIARAARHALGDIAVQGEGPAAPPESAPAALSHFDRLRAIFDGLRTLGSEPPVRKVPDNPVAGLDLITDRSANLLARAANLRYRVLMLEIAIAVYTRNAQEVDGKNVLQTVTQWAVFDEMLGGIRTTAQKLVTMPRERGATRPRPPRRRSLCRTSSRLLGINGSVGSVCWPSGRNSLRCCRKPRERASTARSAA